MKKELKKQIKEDELVSGVEHLAAWGRAHAREVKVGVVLALGVAVLVGSLAYLQSSRQAAARAALAAAAFDGIGRAYPSLREGQRAQYYAAVSRMKMGDRAEAEKQLSEVAKVREGGALEPALARMALANLQRLSGALDKAAESYKAIADDPSFPLPRDYVLMTLALTLEDAHRLEEARVLYQRVSDEFPEGVYAPDARRRADYLKPAVRG
jgi:TolA-binding protein